ncbi:hypothetical protein CCR75_000337 [Bremia lactucae]|uniref:Uncharacterized protein n=1 Tax=Bremia lactucae TaxID=4779 RepID=A0A976FL23_BRELC|nr:hypothetical protein CCR75_009634 [Bremia lactucae]TDH68752.1 hypothetical protein CCR75_000337 [Bremia lactucae]
MAASRFKMLFSNAPSDAHEKLLSPKRKLLYGLFAFGPGTILGIYLYSVKLRMEQKNEEIRLKQIESELNVIQERQNKDMTLAEAMEEMRNRLQRLEEITASQEKAAQVEHAAMSQRDEKEVEKATTSTKKIEAALAMLHANQESQEQPTLPKWLTSSLDGAQGRREIRRQDMLQQDVANYVAKQKK